MALLSGAAEPLAPLRRFQQPEAVLRALIESPEHIVIFALDRHYRYLAYNQNHARTMKQIWGVQIAVGTSMLELIGREDDRAKACKNFDRALAGESFTVIEEYGDTRMERRVYEDIYSPVHNEDGHIIGLAVYLTDITEHRRAQLELERYRGHLEELVEQRTRELETAHARLLHAQKLESLGVLAGGIAHDFNNLLAVVLSRAELCSPLLPEDGAARAHVAIIRETALEARMLTRQLLGYAGKGTFLLETLSLNDIVSGMATLVRASVSKGIRLEYEPYAGVLAVQGDPTQLRQVLLNLVTNAAEAIGANVGSIVVRTGMAEVTALTLKSAGFSTDLPLGTYAYLEVEDTGTGIGAETKNRLFDPFFTTKFTGRGLGLAAVLGIVKAHRGTVLVESEPGRGSKFRVLLPSVDVARLPAEEPRLREVEAFRATGSTLVVDDEAAVRTVTSEVLRSIGYRVLEADGGAAACGLFRQHAAEIDIVLLDLAMPDMNGEETLRELRKIRADVRVVLLTAYAEDEFRMRFVPGDLAGFIAKPYSREELVEVLQRAAPKTAVSRP
jgi:signal transduction histidine kinase/ActR/RegA family two-component response regulator